MRATRGNSERIEITANAVADDLGGETVPLYGLAGKTQGAAFIASSNHDGSKLTIPHAPFALDQLQFGQAQQKAGMIETLGGALPSELVGYFFPVNFPRGGR